MTESELQQLLAQPPDRSLDALPADIWAGVSQRQRQVRLSRRLLALQSVLLIAVVTASLLEGLHYRQVHGGDVLDIFSPRMALSVSTRLAGLRP
ncbi:MAG TPA: hypothetical protein VMF64_10140 [Steroidobacteraceae bacterium]|nr:hypothetical protein [Steroidobacteraceae bacterium]